MHIVCEWAGLTFVLCAMIMSRLRHVLMRDEKEGRKKQARSYVHIAQNIVFPPRFLDIRKHNGIWIWI